MELFTFTGVALIALLVMVLPALAHKQHWNCLLYTSSCPPFPPRSGGRGGSRARRVGPTRARDGAILAGGGEGQGGNGE